MKEGPCTKQETIACLELKHMINKAQEPASYRQKIKKFQF